LLLFLLTCWFTTFLSRCCVSARSTLFNLDWLS